MISKESIGDWIRFSIKILQIYKHGVTKIKKGTESLWVPLENLACKCPKLRVKGTYLIIGELRKLKANF